MPKDKFEKQVSTLVNKDIAEKIYDSKVDVKKASKLKKLNDVKFKP